MANPSPVDIDESAMLIRIPLLWRPGISAQDLCDATRGYWNVGPRRDDAELAMAVVEGVVLEVYLIDAWVRAGTTPLNLRVHTSAPSGRWEFSGDRAPESVRSKYLGSSVKHYFKQGNQIPIRYVNC